MTSHTCGGELLPLESLRMEERMLDQQSILTSPQGDTTGMQFQETPPAKDKLPPKNKFKRKLHFCDGYTKKRKQKNKPTVHEQCEPVAAMKKTEGEKEPEHPNSTNGKTQESSTRQRIVKAAEPVNFIPGTLVWAKLKGYDWWPSRVVHYTEARRGPAAPGQHWVMWYGDYKFSQIQEVFIGSFSDFKAKQNPAKMRGLYKRAVFDALQVAVIRSKKTFLRNGPLNKGKRQKKTKSDHDMKCNSEINHSDDTLTDNERNELMLAWALSGFQPEGPEAFAPSSDDVSDELNSAVMSLAGDTSEVNTKQKNGEGAVAGHNGRFGKPVEVPSLAEDVKALFDEVAEGKRKIEEICLACGDVKVYCQHPLFQGGLCKECKRCFLECSYLFDEDGYQMYCTICGDGKEVVMCDKPGCFRSYCGLCIEILCGLGTVKMITSQDHWVCYMCSGKHVRLLKKRRDWQEKLYQLFLDDKESDFGPPRINPPVPLKDRKPIRVLALFDGIATGFQALKDLGLEVEAYCASEIDEQALQVAQVQHGNAINHLGDVQQITESQIQELGPFDLVLGGSPCNDLSIANPIRRGIFEGSGRLFFEYFRLMMYARPDSNADRPFFWLFENVVGMRREDKTTISRFLQCNPIVVDAKDMSPAHRARYFWGNLPGMHRPPIPSPGDCLTLQECLEPNCGRTAKFSKIQTVTTNMHSLKQTKKAVLPVTVTNGQEQGQDILWCTEMERLFGLPKHYTDVANMGRSQRQKLLGKSWSVPVIKHLLSPLKNYFKCSS